MIKTSQLLNITSPKALLDWMNKNLKYHAVHKGFLYTPKQVIENKQGHCWETTELARHELTSLGYYCVVLYLENKKLTTTHTTLLFRDKNLKWFIFEWAWYSFEGIHGPFENRASAISTFVKKFSETNRELSFVSLIHSSIVKKNDNEDSFINRAHSAIDISRSVVPDKTKSLISKWK